MTKFSMSRNAEDNDCTDKILNLNQLNKMFNNISNI